MQIRSQHKERQRRLPIRHTIVFLAALILSSPTCRFEQSFSDNGGKTREVNWIAMDTRTANESDGASHQR
ncbi:MAG: hypothetical protein DMG62_18115 [Acidobacteria bacterium]|nr:MAG: hypothetical protein DMG63_01755 [Acidobacteriota bacterium]PYY21538.1 MAG: hypothetical protein DMG62_18115 [Acidobacteriota bacterium]